MAKTIGFDGRVALVTGGGGGMGRCYALELARRGAAVVVNDYGGSVDGRAGTSDRAEAVAAEITDAGGRAVANAEAVGTEQAAQAMVDQATSAFGRLDIVVNNAGIALAGSIASDAWDRVKAVYRTNIIGPHAVIRAAWPIMAGQGYGRILNVSSNAALGIGGTPAYAASKAGLIGLTMDTAREGAALGIHVNVLMPVGYSRMIDQVPDPDFVAWMQRSFQPEKVVAAMVPLLSDESTISGRLFSAGGGRVARIAFATNEGAFLDNASAEDFADRMDEAQDMTAATVVTSQQDEMMMFSRFRPMDRAGGPGLAQGALTD